MSESDLLRLQARVVAQGLVLASLLARVAAAGGVTAHLPGALYEEARRAIASGPFPRSSLAEVQQDRILAEVEELPRLAFPAWGPFQPAPSSAPSTNRRAADQART